MDKKRSCCRSCRRRSGDGWWTRPAQSKKTALVDLSTYDREAEGIFSSGTSSSSRMRMNRSSSSTNNTKNNTNILKAREAEEYKEEGGRALCKIKDEIRTKEGDHSMIKSFGQTIHKRILLCLASSFLLLLNTPLHVLLLFVCPYFVLP